MQRPLAVLLLGLALALGLPPPSGGSSPRGARQPPASPFPEGVIIKFKKESDRVRTAGAPLLTFAGQEAPTLVLQKLLPGVSVKQALLELNGSEGTHCTSAGIERIWRIRAPWRRHTAVRPCILAPPI